VHATSPLGSFFIGGFECSAHRRWDGARLDLLASTGHERWAHEDYHSLRARGIYSARDGVRWHLIEQTPGKYDWSSFRPMLHAASATRISVAWDVCHYGWPDFIDIWSVGFIESIAQFAAGVASIVRDESDLVPIYCPINELSYWAWAGGEVGRIGPFGRGRGAELKRQLVRAALAITAAIREVDPRARFLYAEPGIHVASGSSEPQQVSDAEQYRLSQFEALDMITGGAVPELGGHPGALDILGVNFYPDNQWYLGGSTIPLGHHAYRPFREILNELFQRYRRLIVVSETGAEGSARSSWLHYVCAEVRAAMACGVPVAGVCLYPITEYQGWENERLCAAGLFSMPDDRGKRVVDPDLAAELDHQSCIFAPAHRTNNSSLRIAR
jgi:hypothetical protein